MHMRPKWVIWGPLGWKTGALLIFFFHIRKEHRKSRNSIIIFVSFAFNHFSCFSLFIVFADSSIVILNNENSLINWIISIDWTSASEIIVDYFFVILLQSSLYIFKATFLVQNNRKNKHKECEVRKSTKSQTVLWLFPFSYIKVYVLGLVKYKTSK